MIRHDERRRCACVYAEPHPVFLDQPEDLLVGDGVHVPDDQELLLVLHQLLNVLPKQRKRRIGDDDIRLLEQLDAFLAAKIAVAFQLVNADFVRVGDAVVVLVAVVFEVDSPLRRVLAEQVGVAVLVAGGDQLLQLQLLEVVREVVKEVADLGIVAVAQDGLALEMLRVMPQLLLDVGKLGVKLVLLGRLRGVQASIQRLARHSSRFPSLERILV